MVLILLLMRFCGVETHENAAAGEASSLSPHTGTTTLFHCSLMGKQTTHLLPSSA